MRFRLDGVLYNIMNPPMKMRDALTSRLKIMARLDIAEKRLPQDGRIKIRVRLDGRSRDLDLTQPGPPPVLSRETFELTAKRALASLSPMLRAYVREQEVYAADAPGVEVVVDGVDPRALLLIDAVGNEGQPSSVSARVFVYQRNVERLTASIEQIEAEIRGALEREYFSLLKESGAFPMRPWGEAVTCWARAVPRWDAAACDAALTRLLAADEALKGTRVSSEEQVVTSLVLGMCADAARAA